MLSIILLSYYSEKRLVVAYDKLFAVLSKEGIPFELIIMDDGSKDRSFEIAEELEQKHSNVRAYQLSKNYTSDYSIFAGLSVSKGDCVTVIPDDEQIPYEIIIDMFRLWQKGHQLIIPNRISRDDSFISSAFSNTFYFIINKFSNVIKYPPGGADAFLIDREVVDLINSRIKPINTAVVPELLRLGFGPFFHPYSRTKSLNKKSRWSFRKKMKLMLDTFFSSSSFPIKLISGLGFFFSTLSLILILLYSYIYLFGNQSFWGYRPKGWTSIILFITFFSGLILFSLGIIAEYIWRIYEEVKNRPGYIIKQKKNNRQGEK